MSEDCWFYLEPYIHISIKSGKMLLYNTLDATSIETSQLPLIEFVSELFNESNLGVTKLSNNKMLSKPYNDFVAEIRRKYMGDIISINDINKKPIQPFPILNLQKDIDRLQNQNIDTVGKNVLSYLSEITLFINNSCKQNCSACQWYAKQTKCCVKNINTAKNEELPFELIKELISTYKNVKFALCGGNIFDYTQWNKLAELISTKFVTLYANYLNIADADAIPLTSSIIVPTTLPLNMYKFELAIEKTHKFSTNFHFLINCENDLEHVEQIISSYKLPNHTIVPIYNGLNKAFFQKNVFIDKEDLFENPLSMKRIFTQQSANAKFFGNLYILPNQDVVANLNTKPLGNLRHFDLLSLIRKELLENTAWRYTRTHKPCADCLYQYLCPPPSNYEIVMQRKTMCNIGTTI